MPRILSIRLYVALKKLLWIMLTYYLK